MNKLNIIICFIIIFVFSCKSIDTKNDAYSYDNVRKWFKAVENGDKKTIEDMLKSGFKIDTKGYDPEGGDYGLTALMLSASFGDLDMVQFLVSKGAKINYKTLRGSALLMAIANNHDNTAIFLMSKNADINMAAIDGRTPLMAASSEGNLKMVEMLLKANANKEAKHSSGKKAIDYAKDGRFYDIVELLK